MADFPKVEPVQTVQVSCLSVNSIGTELAAIASVAAVSAAIPAANRVIFVPFVNPEPALIKKVWWHNGATVAGSVDCGVYDENGVQLIQAGSIVQATINVLQEVDVADTYIGRGRFYLAIAASNATATFFRVTPSVQLCKVLGMAENFGGVPLAATYVLAANTAAFIPICGISLRTLVA